MEKLDKNWHLSEKNATEMGVAEFHLQVWRLFWAYHHWIEEGINSSSSNILLALEAMILCTIRNSPKPKTSNELAKILNRSDTHNIRYSLKKLTSLNLIEKVKASGDSNKNIAFKISEQGIKTTDDFAYTRQKALVPMILRDAKLTASLKPMAEKLIILKAIFEEAERTAATYMAPEEAPEENDELS